MELQLRFLNGQPGAEAENAVIEVAMRIEQCHPVTLQDETLDGGFQKETLTYASGTEHVHVGSKDLGCEKHG